ncbi:MAG: DUF1387 domain-containing protein [Actinobacteria bacterium]|nr:DUF1387 domain-containing protein [Actinomycetota bacterium]
MAITEQSRKQLYQRLDEVLGDEHATTLMEHLPPRGWADVATKQDLAQLEERLTLRFDRELARVEYSLNERMSALERDLTARMDALERQMAELRMEFHHFREVTERRFDEMERRFEVRFEDMEQRFLTKTEFYRTITAQTLTLVLFMAALVTRMGG